MEVVLDTVSLQHLLRSKSGQPGDRTNETCKATSVDNALQDKRLTFGVDNDDSLISEWQRTCGQETVRSLIVHWESLGAIINKGNPPPLSASVRKKLRIAGFHDTIDKLVLRLGLVVADKTIVSDDGDFWNPLNGAQKGNANAVVARICREDLEIRVILLAGLIADLKRNL